MGASVYKHEKLLSTIVYRMNKWNDRLQDIVIDQMRSLIKILNIKIIDFNTKSSKWGVNKQRL